MILSDVLILLFAFIALIGPLAFLIFLNRLPRRWRLGIYFPCTGIYLFIADFFYLRKTIKEETKT